jgi:hypothetical protein
MLAVTILAVTIYHLVILLRTKNPFIKQFPAEKTSGQFSGDYFATISLADTTLSINETVRFPKVRLDSFIYHRWFNLMSGDKPLDSLYFDSGNKEARRKIEVFKPDYFEQLIRAKWRMLDTSGAQYAFQRSRKQGFRLERWSRRQTVPVALLFEIYRGADTVNKDTLKIYNRRLFDFNYKLSAGSKLQLFAPHGLVKSTYPAVKPEDMLDTDDREVFRFAADDLNKLTEGDQPAMVMRVQVLNPLLNNPIGEVVEDWSPGKLLGWALAALIAIFADKVKEKIFSPIADKLWPNRKKKGSKRQKKND